MHGGNAPKMVMACEFEIDTAKADVCPLGNEGSLKLLLTENGAGAAGTGW